MIVSQETINRLIIDELSRSPLRNENSRWDRLDEEAKKFLDQLRYRVSREYTVEELGILVAINKGFGR